MTSCSSAMWSLKHPGSPSENQPSLPARLVIWTPLSSNHKSTESPVSNSSNANNILPTQKISKTMGNEEKGKEELTTNLSVVKYFKLGKRKLSSHDQKRIIENK